MSKYSSPLNITHGPAVSEDGTAFRVHEASYAADLQRIINVTKEVLETTGNLLDEVRMGGRKFIRSNNFGARFRECLNVPFEDLEGWFPMHELHPFYYVFKEATHDLRKSNREDERLELLRNAVTRIRSHRNCRDIRQRMESCERLERHNAARMRDLISAARAERAKVMLIRLDTGYRSLWSEWSRGYCLSVSLEQARSEHAQMLAFLDKGRYSQHLLGYAWKLEWGVLKGWHWHWVLLFDGNRLCKDMAIGQAIGKHWESTVTGGRGMFYNANMHKERYRRCIVGTFHRDDPEIWPQVNEKLRYLTKSDLVMRLKRTNRIRAFGIGGPLAKLLPKRGASRCSDLPGDEASNDPLYVPVKALAVHL